MTLSILQPALLMTIQDAGRRGYQRFGMPESGPMDWWAFRAANLLVGNQPDAACVEVGFSGAEFRIKCRSLLAVCGAGYRLYVNHWEMPLWMAFIGKSGDRIRLEKVPGGNWVFMAVAGGIQTESWMGSRSTYSAAGLGTPLIAGEQLPLQAISDKHAIFAGRSIPRTLQPAYSSESCIRVIPGPHQARFIQSSWEAFLASAYQVSPYSDRMGYRLEGPQLAHHESTDLVSQGMVLGAIQVPGDGQLIVMMPDHPTTGGYACIAVVARVDLPLIAQAVPVCTNLRFTPIDVQAAQSAWRQAIELLDSVEYDQEDVWTGF